MRTSNPALSAKTFLGPRTQSQTMTIDGTVNKSFILIGIVVACAYYAWMSAFPQGWASDSLPQIPKWYFPAMIASLILAVVIIFKQTTAPLALEGLTLGALSAFFEAQYPGIVLQAVLCTCGTFIALLLAYRSRLIKATENFKLGVVAATGGFCIVYIIDLALRFFGHSVPLLHENGPLGIAVSVVITAVAALNLVLDFDFIEKGADSGAPKHMEWYAAFGLLVTLIWLYIEFLRLLAKSRKK